MHLTLPRAALQTVALVLLASLWHQDIAAQTSAAEKNARVLRPYMQPYQVTKLEWELLQFNLLWSGSYAPPASHLISYPVIFEYRTNRFRSTFFIVENREYQDPEPWSRLSRLKRESNLQGAVNQLLELLGQSFPELKTNPGLLYIEFKFRQSGGGFVNAAKFENGILAVVE
jgi:hypothetical protein